MMMMRWKLKPEDLRFESVLSRGAFGTAWLVRSNADSRMYVMKRLALDHMNEKEKDEAHVKELRERDAELERLRAQLSKLPEAVPPTGTTQ